MINCAVAVPLLALGTLDLDDTGPIGTARFTSRAGPSGTVPMVRISDLRLFPRSCILKERFHYINVVIHDTKRILSQSNSNLNISRPQPTPGS